MSGTTRRIPLLGAAVLVACLLAACGGTAPNGAAGTGSSSGLAAVSLSNPATPEAAEAVGLCVLRDHLDQVVGMARVPHGSDVPRYAAVTGNEPEIETADPVWVVRYSGVIRVPVRGQAGSVALVDARDPTCIVVGGVSTWLLTGGATSPDGTVSTPLPAPQSLLPLPTLAP
jgi:hypothetical protein